MSLICNTSCWHCIAIRTTRKDLNFWSQHLTLYDIQLQTVNQTIPNELGSYALSRTRPIAVLSAWYSCYKSTYGWCRAMKSGSVNHLGSSQNAALTTAYVPPRWGHSPPMV
eukprot:981751-Amphidinium_carterae.1